jgi:alkylation response protein AidB-like acyl-CoA dehydrogenase
VRPIPEAYGGAGAGFTELGIVAQEMGRALFCGPFLSTAVLAAAALVESGDDNARRRWLPAIAAGELIATLAIPGTLPADWEVTARHSEADGWALDGTAGFVLDGHVADLILVPAATAEGTSLFWTCGTAPGLARTPLSGGRSRRSARG